MASLARRVFALETLPDGLPVVKGDPLYLDGITLEASGEEPGDLAAGTPEPLGEAAPALRLSLPAGAYRPALWSAADGSLLEAEGDESPFDFELPLADSWYRLDVRDHAGAEVWSLWLRAE